jgi:serine protease Do
MRTILAAHAALAFSALILAATASAQPVSPTPKAVLTAAGISAGASFLGVGIADIDADRAKELKLKEPAGVEITRVEEDSPAAKAGLRVGDVVLEYNGQKVEGMEQFGRLVRETPVGREVKLLISRNGAPQTLVARIAARRGPVSVTLPRIEIPALPAAPDIPHTIMMWRTTLLGIEGESLHGQLADYFGVKEGVLVRSVMPDTPAAKAGLKAGDVILKIDDSKVSSPSEITTVLRRLQDKKTVPVMIMREHKEMTMNVTVDEGRSQWDFRMPPRIVFGDRIKL